MKRSLSVFFAVMLVASVASTAKASLLGDVVTMAHNYPFLNSAPQTPLTTAVTADASDGFQYFNLYFANPSATSVRVDFQRSATWIARGGLPQFNGFTIRNIDTPLQSASTSSTNWSGWNDSRIIIPDDSTLLLSFQSLSFNSSNFVVVDLDFGEQQQDPPPPDPEADPIPEPASMTLLGTGLIGMIGLRRKKLFS